MEGASFFPLRQFPKATDQIEVRLAGAADTSGVGQLTNLVGGNIANPFAVSAAVLGVGFGFKPPAAGRYDVLNVTTGEYLARDWWIEDETKVTGRALESYIDTREILTFILGAASVNCSTAMNGQICDLSQASNALITSNRVTNKPICFRVKHNGVAASLMIDGVDVGLGGAAGDVEEFVAEFDGADWVISPPVVMTKGTPA